MSDAESVAHTLTDAVALWYESQRSRNGTITTNVMTVGLILCEHLRRGFPLERTTYATGSQVQGISGAKITQILAAHGESRRFTSEGGRTSRGSLPKADELAQRINEAGLAAGYGELGADQQDEIIDVLQGWFVRMVNIRSFGVHPSRVWGPVGCALSRGPGCR